MTMLEVADRVGLLAVGGIVYVAKLPDGPFYAMNDTAAVIWEECLAGPRESLVERVGVELEVGVAELAGEVDRLVDALLAAEILRHV